MTESGLSLGEAMALTDKTNNGFGSKEAYEEFCDEFPPQVWDYWDI